MEGPDAGDGQHGGYSRRVMIRGAAGAGMGLVGLGLLGAAEGSTLSGTKPAAAQDPVLEPPDLQLETFVDPLRVPPVLRPDPHRSIAELTVTMRTAAVRLHSQMPKTVMWTYEGHFPGPTIEVRRRQRLHVTWQNEISGPLPLDAVELPDDVPGRPPGVPVADYPGRDGATPLATVAALPAWLAVHLHGAHTGGGNDGWPENGVSPGEAQLSEYANDQGSASLWYHDHAMHMTRFTILSGLLGMYIIRDAEEAKLNLPAGRYEIPLILADRNFNLDDQGKLNGRLLHKISLARVEPARIITPFSGPFVAVNGVIWPYLEVEPRWYRFRVLNTCNARVFRLMVLDEHNNVVPGVMKLIGTDAGLLGKPVSVDSWLTLSAAERADVLIDFSAFRGRRLRLVNTRPGTTPGEPDLENNIVEPNVMQFRVGNRAAGRSFTLPAALSPTFARITRGSVSERFTRRLIVLTPPGAPGDPEMWEMAEVDPATVTLPSDGVIQLQGADGTVRTYRRMAASFGDPLTIAIPRNTTEVWDFLNLGGPPHPMHIHMIRFQALGRDLYDTSGFNPGVRGTTKPVKFVAAGALEVQENGWKDVVRVAAGLNRQGEMVTVAAQFGRQSGRFLYHCHLLEHEHGMMRPFTVQPAEVIALAGGHAAGHQHD